MTKQWMLRAAVTALSVGTYTPYLLSVGGQPPAAAALRQAQGAPPAGQSATRLSDGQWLLVGGEGHERSAVLWDPQAGSLTPTIGLPQASRAGHTATVVADGRVLIAGGQRGSAAVDTAEIFNAQTGLFTPLVMSGAANRALHTATLLTDGRVLVAGGSNGSGVPPSTEVWDIAAQTVTPIFGGSIGRIAHTATLMPDGRVLLTGGRIGNGSPADGSDIVDPRTSSVVHAPSPAFEQAVPIVAESDPANGATDVAVDAHVALRFSDALVPDTITPQALTLSGPHGPVSTRIVVAENGHLAFVWPAVPFTAGTTYVLQASGPATAVGLPLNPTTIAFTTTARESAQTDAADAEDWIPNADSIKDGWRTGRPPSPWEGMAPLLAAPGVTAISGRVLTLDGRPLRGVTLELEGDQSTQSDHTGRFLLVVKASGTARRVLKIEGASASQPGRTYGFFEYGLTVVSAQTNVLPFTIWMPKIDTAHAVRIPSPTSTEVVVTTPYIPGLELHIPPSTVIIGEDEKPVTQVSITPIPVDRPPFPLAKNVEVPVYFTVQPGGAYVHTSGTGLKGAQLVYPNYRHDPAGQRLQFYHYDPDVKGWYVYGMGSVTPSETQVKPDPATRIYSFTGAMINDGTPTPPGGQTPGAPTRADPVDPSTGLFVMSKTDLYLPDVIPLAVTRTYNSGDGYARPMGRSMTHAYAMFLHSELQYQQVDLILPAGGKVHYVRTSAGTGFADAVFVHQETQTTSATPTAFYKSVIGWNGNGWDLTLKDGTTYVFGDVAPLQAIRDRFGNTVTITHANGQTGNITQVTSPNGRWISFTYDGSNRITQAKDNIGRIVAYTYDANGNLSTVTDPENGVTRYTYDASNRMATIKDGRGVVYLTNLYQNGRVATQILADPTAVYTFAYTLDGSGKITQTDITDPLGHVERLTFNADHYIVTDVEALGTSLQRTTTTERQTGSNLVTAVTDGLSRRTAFTYDSKGNVLTATRLAGTSDAVTTTYTYEASFGQLATITDPLNHTWTLGYDSLGRVTSATDPLSHQTAFAWNGQGQVTSVTDALSHTWQFGYTGSDLTSTTDPLSAVQRRFVDGAGRLIAVTDPLGRQTRFAVDKLNRVTSLTDPIGGQTSFAYDANANLLTLTDALTHTTTYAYDASDQVATRTDPVQKMASYQYDTVNHLTQAIDRKGQATSYQYDALARLSRITYADSSTIDYTYDLGDRCTQIVDSANGTITRAFDGLDRLTSEVSPNGTVSYTYDADSRRASFTVSGQSAVTYGHDAAHRLTSITQGSNVVAFTYDNANRRSTLTFPNGIVATSGYDAANHLTTLAYTLSGNPVGDLTYSYDAAGNRTSVGGTFARTGLPQALASATYDAANRISTWGGTTFSYDLNGSLGSDGPTSYLWNARNQLTALAGGQTASFQYDGASRRRGKTVAGATTNFLYDRLNLVQELTSGGTPTANLVNGLRIDEAYTRTDSTATATFLTDVLGSTLALADASGNLQTQYTFESFGATTASGATSTSALQFTGRENDATNLYYYRARFHSPRLQRFLSEDPLGLAGGINSFAYAQNQPTVYVDRLGLKPGSPFGDPGSGAPDGAGDPNDPNAPGNPGIPGSEPGSNPNPDVPPDPRECGPTLGQQTPPSEMDAPSAGRRFVSAGLDAGAEKFGGGAIVGAGNTALEGGAALGNAVAIARQRNNQLAAACAIAGSCSPPPRPLPKCVQ
jgi:RHS repeat-associated protein